MEIDKKIIKKLIEVLDDLKKSIGETKDLESLKESIKEELNYNGKIIE